jgi:hypothetical protein
LYGVCSKKVRGIDMGAYKDIKTGLEQAIETDWLTKGISEKKLKKEKTSAMKKAERDIARERKKSIRAYRKMHRRHRRELVKLAKQVREWDYGWLYDSTIMQIRHMYEYYSEGNNIWQSEESLNTILEQLKHVLDLDDEMKHLWDNYESNVIKNDDGSISVSEEGHKKYVTIKDREQELYEEIYSYIGKYIQWWWD